MSWNIQRPDGVPEMAPLEGQASMSHSQLLSNRDALERKLSQREPRQELVSRGIMPAVSAAPAILSQRTKLERAKTGDLLQKKIRTRPNRAQLIQRHILKETPGAVDPSLIDKQMQLKRKKLEDNLNDKLSYRPGPLELVKENILEAGTPMSQAVQEGTVPFTETTDYLQSLSPDSVDSPDASPSPDLSHVSSPSSVGSPPASTSITSSVQALASLQAQTKKHTQQQQAKQQQQHQLFLQQQNGLNLIAPTQLPVQVSSTAPKKETGKSRKKAAKPKVKKYKYHEYRPPNGEVQKCDLPSDSPYGLLLQQQQLYLQLQVLYQNYPHHCMLPSIPENVKLGANGSKNGSGSDSEKTVKIEDMRVIDMRRALKERGLPVFGSKTDLIKRLKEAGPLPTEVAPNSNSAASVVVSTQEQITTSVPSVSQAFPRTTTHPPVQRSNSLPMQNAQNSSLEAVEQLKMQILANNQSLQQLSVPPEVQQQLQQLQYLNLQLQLKHLNIQQQQNIQPKPQNTPVTNQNVAMKKESLTDTNCSFSPPPDHKQMKEQKPLFVIQQQGQHVQLSPGNHSPQQQLLHQPQQVDNALAHLQEQAQSLDLSPSNFDSNPSSVESHVLPWDQQHPLFDGESESFPSPGSQHSDLSNLSPLQMDQLSHSMDTLPNGNLFQANMKPESHQMQRSYSERSSSDCPDDYFLMLPQTKPRSLSEPQFPVSTHKRSSSFPSNPFAAPPPSYEAHMAAQSQKQNRNLSVGGQIGGGLAMPSTSPKQEDMELPLESVIQDKELSQELQKAMMKNFSSLDHDDILEILGEPRSQLPTSSSSFAGILSTSQSSPAQSFTGSKSPSLGYLRTLPTHSSVGRISKSCEDVSQMPVGNNSLSNFDYMLMSPMSPMRVDSCDTDESSTLMDHTSNAIPIPMANNGAGRTDNLGWLDLSLSPSAHNVTQQGSAELSHNNNFGKGTPPAFLYDPMTTFKGDEALPYLSLFDLETPTALQPPTDFAETMDYCI